MCFNIISISSNSVPECSICWDNEEEEFIAEADENNHQFHKNCLQKWIQQCLKDGIAPTCPLCRIIIEKIDGIEIQKLEPTLEEKERRVLVVSALITEIYRLCGNNCTNISIKEILENNLFKTTYLLKIRGKEVIYIVGIKEGDVDFQYV